MTNLKSKGVRGMKKEYITISKNKNGEWDFEVSAMVGDLDYPDIEEMRSMIITAIYVTENMWRRKQETKNRPSQVV